MEVGIPKFEILAPPLYLNLIQTCHQRQNLGAGMENGTRFSITAPIGSSIVGFYGRAGSRLVDVIGVYLRQL